MDWRNPQDVIRVARQIGIGVQVVKYPDRANYSIKLANAPELPAEVRVLYRSEP